MVVRLRVESPQCPEGHYDLQYRSCSDRLGPGLNPLNARKGITTYRARRNKMDRKLRVESPQCPEGHYDPRATTTTTIPTRRVESPQCPEGHYDLFRQGARAVVLNVGLNPLNARKGITTLAYLLATGRLNIGLNPLNARKGITTRIAFGLPPMFPPIVVESPQCPEGHYDPKVVLSLVGTS